MPLLLEIIWSTNPKLNTEVHEQSQYIGVFWEVSGKITSTISLSFLSEAFGERGDILSRKKGSRGTFFFKVNFLAVIPRNLGFT